MSRIKMENQSRGSAPATTSATTAPSGRPTRIVDGGQPSGPQWVTTRNDPRRGGAGPPLQAAARFAAEPVVPGVGLEPTRDTSPNGF